MESVVVLSKNAHKKLKKLPKHVLIQFDLWVEVIETEGYMCMQSVRGYRDHALTGNRKGQRSSSLSRSWRIIYVLDEKSNCICVEVLEVNHHEY